MPKNPTRFNQKQLSLLWIGPVIGLLLLLAACGPATDSSPMPDAESIEEPSPAAENTEPAAEGAYPPPVAELPEVEDAYPVEEVAPPPSPTAVPDSYPAVAEEFAEPRFRIDLPLKAGGTTISGQAPPDLAIAAVDITYNGIVLGSGRSDADGRFEFGVQPLPDGNRVGLAFAELEQGKTFSEMAVDYFPHRGEGFVNIPNVGVFFDSALVEP